jgi:hypothetical protein
MFGRKYWAEGLLSEHSAKKDGPKVRHDFHFLAPCVYYTSFFKQKMHERFRLLAMKHPLPKRSETTEILLVQVLSPKSDPWGQFVRTFGQFTMMVNVLQSERI